MELNEEVESIEDVDKLEKILANVDEQVHRFLVDMEDSFSRNDLSNARRLLNKMSYLRRTKQLLDKKLGKSI